MMKYNGRHALAFDRSWSVQTFGKVPFEQDTYDTLREDMGRATANEYRHACRKAHWHGATLYEYGEEPPRYPMPALLVDSVSDLGERWANWIDDDGLNGHRY